MWIEDAQEAGCPPTLGSPRFLPSRWFAMWIIAIVCANARSMIRVRRAVSGAARVSGVIRVLTRQRGGANQRIVGGEAGSQGLDALRAPDTWEQRRHLAAVPRVGLAVDAQEIALFEPDRGEDVARERRGEERAPDGHRRRRPEHEEPADVRRMADDPMEPADAELRRSLGS